MKGMFLAAGLAAVTVGGAALVVGPGKFSHRNSCPLVSQITESRSDDGAPDSSCDGCPTCRPTRQVIDVANLSAGFAEPNAAPVISFDEPPLAKPNGVSQVNYEVTAAREALPPPREADGLDE